MAAIFPNLLPSGSVGAVTQLDIQPKLKGNPTTATLKNIQEIKQTHGQLVKLGFTRVPSAVTKLIRAYGEVGNFCSLDYARKAFELSVREGISNLFMGNSLIRGYFSSGFDEEAISIYLQMIKAGITPDRFTYPFVISACAKLAAFHDGILAHASLIKVGVNTDIYALNSLIYFYAECHEIDRARKVFDGMLKRNVVSWTSLICGYSHGDQPEEAITLFDEMKIGTVEPNSVTMACVVSACAKLQNLSLGESVLDYIAQNGIRVSPTLANSLVDMYMKCGALMKAKQMFDKCEQKSLVLWNTMLSNYSRQGMANEALQVFGEMLNSGIVPDRVTMLAAISASAQLGVLLLGRQCHAFVIRKMFITCNSVLNSIIDMYMKCGSPTVALSVFHGMLQKNVVSWNSVISGFIANGDSDSAWEVFRLMPDKDQVSWNTMIGSLVRDSRFQEAINLFCEMQSASIDPDRITMVSLASACGYLGALDLAKWVHACIDKHKISCDIRLGTALVDMYARCGDAASSLQVFGSMKKKDVSAYTAAIGSMAMEGNGRGAIILFEEMIEQGVEPDAIAFVGLLTACSHSRLVEEGRMYFQLMVSKYGITPQMVHYGCMVDLLGRSGLIEEAKSLIESMPMEPNDVVWGALLGACRVHNNVEMADHAAERVLELAPERTGIHVLLSNVFASEGRWDEVAKVRLNLKDKGVQKLPGCSSIEVQGSIHEFTCDDNSHPQIIQITQMLHEIGEKIKEVGHVPDLTNVLLDVDECEKKHLLGRHSEKLAMAFGLINTGTGVPIRVMKNLRTCSDCHSFAKLVSQVYDREIIIRDNNRFHFFREGKCSCMDYW